MKKIHPDDVCEECNGRGAWFGLGVVECWRCYGTRLERPTLQQKIKADKAIERMRKMYGSLGRCRKAHTRGDET